jgi:hypothetical protein
MYLSIDPLPIRLNGVMLNLVIKHIRIYRIHNNTLYFKNKDDTAVSTIVLLKLLWTRHVSAPISDVVFGFKLLNCIQLSFRILTVFLDLIQIHKYI